MKTDEKLNQIGLWTHLNVFFQAEARKINFNNLFEFFSFSSPLQGLHLTFRWELLMKHVTNKVCA